jgi:hypothetical protein
MTVSMIAAVRMDQEPCQNSLTMMVPWKFDHSGSPFFGIGEVFADAVYEDPSARSSCPGMGSSGPLRWCATMRYIRLEQGEQGFRAQEQRVRIRNRRTSAGRAATSEEPRVSGIRRALPGRVPPRDRGAVSEMVSIPSSSVLLRQELVYPETFFLALYRYPVRPWNERWRSPASPWAVSVTRVRVFSVTIHSPCGRHYRGVRPYSPCLL